MSSSAADRAGSMSGGSARRPPLSPSSTSTTPKKQHKGGSRIKIGSGNKKQADAVTLKEQIFQLFAIAVVAGLVAKSGFKSVEWAKQQLKPFCDSGNETIETESGTCIPCPSNGFCQDGGLECLAGFRRVGKTCAPDKEIDRTARKLASSIKRHVCGAAARSVCDGSTGSVWLSEAEVLQSLKEEGLEEQLGKDETFSLVWEKTADLARGEGLAMQTSLLGNREFHCPRDVAQGFKSLRCRVKELLWDNIIILFFSSPVVVLIGSFVVKCLHRRETNSRAEELYLDVCEALEEKALESKGVDGGESWVVVSRLRDHLLSSNERKNLALWKQVERMVQEDSRIDQYQKKVKGEMKIVWEWQVEGAIRTPGSRKKAKQQRTDTAAMLPEAPLQVRGNGAQTSRYLEEFGSPLQL